MADSITRASAVSTWPAAAANGASFEACDIKMHEIRVAAMALVNGAPREDVLRGKLARFSLPELAPRRAARSSALSVLWQGPDQWLCVCTSEHDAIDNLLGTLRAALDDSGACVTDLSHARTVVRIEGGGAVELLCRLCPYDIESMRTNDCVMTRLGHQNVSLHCTMSQQFDIYVMRSFGRSLWDSVEQEANSFAATL